MQLRSYKSTTIPFLESIKAEIIQVQHLLLSDNPLKQQTACRLFKLMGNYQHNNNNILRMNKFIKYPAREDKPSAPPPPTKKRNFSIFFPLLVR